MPRGADGRATEIQRLIGRSLRAVIDRAALGPVTVHVDTDVLNADGGTRTAAITAAFVAVADALRRHRGDLVRAIIKDSIAAVSAGIVAGEPVLDLDYPEDSAAEVDLNVVRLGGGGLVEVQGTGEGGTFSRPQLDRLLDLAGSRDRSTDPDPARLPGPRLAVIPLNRMVGSSLAWTRFSERKTALVEPIVFC